MFPAFLICSAFWLNLGSITVETWKQSFALNALNRLLELILTIHCLRDSWISLPAALRSLNFSTGTYSFHFLVWRFLSSSYIMEIVSSSHCLAVPLIQWKKKSTTNKLYLFQIFFLCYVTWLYSATQTNPQSIVVTLGVKKICPL